jgi:hypothetical protein
MKLLTSIAASTALALSIVAVPVVASAQTSSVTVAGSNCGFNANQIRNGFTCVATFETTGVSREIGGGRNCQDAELSVVTYTSINRNGQVMEDRTVVEDLGQTDWGSSYRNVDGCNF